VIALPSGAYATAFPSRFESTIVNAPRCSKEVAHAGRGASFERVGKNVYGDHER
jgi:hypothetical protein